MTTTLRGPVRRERPEPVARTVERKDATGAVLSTVDLDPVIFGIEPNAAVLHQVVTAQLAHKRSGSHSTKTRSDVAAKVLPLVEDEPGWNPSEPNRWGTGALDQARVRPELVVEVRYDKVQGDRFRHGTKLIRWRPDKDPKDCTWRELRPPKAAGSVEALLT